MITLSLAPLPVSGSSEAGRATDARAAGFGTALQAATAGMNVGNPFNLSVGGGPGMPTNALGLASQGSLVAGQQTLLDAGALVAPFSSRNLTIPPPAERFGGARGPGLEARMVNLREIFGAALAQDRAERPVQQVMSDAVQGALDRQSLNKAAIAPAIVPAAPPIAEPVGPGVIDVVGSPAPIEGKANKSNVTVFEDELIKSKAERNVQEMITNELEKSQADRPISATVQEGLTKSQKDRPIEQRTLESLIAGMDELQISPDIQEKLFATEADAAGTIDSKRKNDLLAEAETKLQEKYQAIIDSFVARMGMPTPPASTPETT